MNTFESVVARGGRTVTEAELRSEFGALVLHGPYVFAADDPALADGGVVELFTPVAGSLMMDVYGLVSDDWNDLAVQIGSGQGVSVGEKGIVHSPTSSDQGTHSNAGSSIAFAGVMSPYVALLSSDPIEVWLSQDGKKGGDPSLATAGSITLWFLTIDPS